uniref:RAB17, member RAS oncogene family n=3 Tax=Rousettus aegyptiacus TaxID=9407 RepID=A0A7J8JKG1_ROUAE|nr:RAB17, member RAS oncogene family [Rousettus aegyptiacus]
MLVGNKTDLGEEREVSFEEGAEFAASRGLLFTETSARLNHRVTEAFGAVGPAAPRGADGETGAAGTRTPGGGRGARREGQVLRPLGAASGGGAAGGAPAPPSCPQRAAAGSVWTVALDSDSPLTLVCWRVLEVAGSWRPAPPELAGSCRTALVSDGSWESQFRLPTPDTDRIPNAQTRRARPCQAGCALCCLRTQRNETGRTTWRADGGLAPGAAQDPPVPGPARGD